MISDRSLGESESTTKFYAPFRGTSNGHLSAIYCSAASRTTQASDTFFWCAMSSRDVYSSGGKLMVARTDKFSADADFSFRFAPLVTWVRSLVGEYSTAPQFTIAVKSMEEKLKHPPDAQANLRSQPSSPLNLRPQSYPGYPKYVRLIWVYALPPARLPTARRSSCGFLRGDERVAFIAEPRAPLALSLTSSSLLAVSSMQGTPITIAEATAPASLQPRHKGRPSLRTRSP